MALAAPEVDFLKHLIVERSGNIASSIQDYLLESRLTPLARQAGLENVNALVAELRRIPTGSIPEQVAEAMTIKETSFFRDILPFDALRTQILPRLMAKRAASRSLSIWCGASSSGQEPYSIAMTIREHVDYLRAWNVKILATDLSDEMVRRTQEGVYSQFEVSRGLSPAMLARHFERAGTQWRARQELRRMIEVRRLNLAGSWPAVPLHDVVFLRNVLIYFDQAAKERILTRIHKVMRLDGYLILGGGETLMAMNVPFVREPVGRTVCFRPVAL